jgi:D-alanyl-D-alanine carboxypeptidase
MPVGPDQHLRIGSNTKTWVGTVILKQLQEGRLSLDDPVAKYRPDVPDGQHITIAELLDMRGGLYDYSETRELNATLDREPRKVWRPEELLALAFRRPPYFAPGAGFHYSNTNTVLLGLIAEKLEGGKPLARILEDRLFKPLDYTDANPSWGWAAGAGISTANDLATWVEALVGGRLLDAPTQQLRLASVRPIDVGNANSARYGLAIAKALLGLIYAPAR